MHTIAHLFNILILVPLIFLNLFKDKVVRKSLQSYFNYKHYSVFIARP